VADLHMVHLVSVDTPFEADVLVARLGAEGIVWERRGATGIYPVGRSHVYVDEADLEVARELLLTDAVEAVFDDDDIGHE
jgi:hypothetical protein